MITPLDPKSFLLRAARQQQFLEVIDRDAAEARFRQHLKLEPLGDELVPTAQALGRILSRDVISNVDVPGFDRSRVDGFALPPVSCFISLLRDSAVRSELEQLGFEFEKGAE